tara:strand:- start:213 stop:764 length:552 start_codon:yes stop_codon:yes gene_type:complete
MAYKYKDRYLKVGVAWKDDSGFSHPYNWASSWSADDLKKWGVTVEKDVDTSYDDRFYWAKNVEKKLEDENVVDEKGQEVIDSATGKQMIQRGLKHQWIKKTKSTANGLLTVSDWYVTRKSETDIAIPSNISKYRSDVRNATKTIEDKINACKKLDDFKKLFDVPMKDGQPTGNAPIFDFPNEI